MTENNDQQQPEAKKEKNRLWMSAALWADREDIRESAENYQQTKWYASLRFWPAALVLILTWVSAVIVGNYASAIAYSCVLCPLLYLNVKGYRWSLLLFALLYTIDKAGALYMDLDNPKSNPIILIIWWVIIVGATLSAFRIENYRHKHQMAGHANYGRDLAVVLAFLGLSFAGGYFYLFNNRLTVEQRGKIAFSYGVVERYSNLIGRYCHAQGVDLKKLPEQFHTAYQTEIAAVEKWVNKNQSFKTQLGNILENYKKSIDQEFDDERKLLIMLELAHQEGKDVNDLAWKPEYDRLLSPQEYCEFVDDNFDLFEQSGSFEEFVQSVRDLEQQ